jgi:hypothetical protein
MAKFKNIVTGNVLETDNPLTIKLMENSDRYEAMDAPAVEAAVPAKKSSKAKAAAAPAEDA